MRRRRRSTGGTPVSRQSGKSAGLTRRAFLRAGVGGAAALSAAGPHRASRAARAEAGRPNVLLIMTDQQHIDTISARQCRHLKTPGLDSLCRRGTTFARSYCTYPLCSPARSSLWTGRMPSETGVYRNGLPIHKSVPNLGQWFRRQSGYETIYAGKWHLPGSFTHSVPGFTVLTPGVSGQGNLGDTSTSLACEGYLRHRAKDKPFLMVASFFQPHDICQWLRLNQSDPGRLRYAELADELPALPANFAPPADEPAALRAQRDRNEPGATKGNWSPLHWRYYMWSYYRHVEMVDAEIGRLLAALDATGHADSTLVIFTSDHGEGLARHQMVRKSSLYDEASAVPMIVSLPGRVPAGAVDDDHLVSGLDVASTVCDYAGVEPPPGIHGRSLRGLLEGRAGAWRSFLACELSSGSGRLARMIRSRRHKFVRYHGDPVEQLFDMAADPGETKNLAREASAASVLAEHRKMLADWEARLTPAPSLPAGARWPRA